MEALIYKKTRNLIKEKNKYIPELIILFIITYSLYLGITYSTYHTDPWHWGVAAGLAIDFINNFKLFNQIYILYGPGFPILLKIINFFYTVNYYTIGVITSVIYCLNIIFIYLTSIKISNKINALVIVLIFFSFTHYPQTPWPDFYAGFCITLSIFFLNLYCKRRNIIYILIASLLLALSITFRTTYLISIAITIFLYVTFIKLSNINISNHITKYFLFTAILIFIYFFILLISGNLKLWFTQGILSSSQLISKHYIAGYDISYIYLVLKFTYHFIIPQKLENFYFLVLFISNFIFSIFFIRKNFSKIKELEKENILLYLTLGITGLVQSLYQSDIFRSASACVSIFFALIYFLNKIKNKKIFYIRLIIIILLIPLLPINSNISPVNIFPTVGYVNKNNEHIKNKKKFFLTDIKFFDKHKFDEETKNYYTEMKLLICNYKTIINYSVDRTLIYICDRKNSIPSPSVSLSPFFVNYYLENKYRNKNLETDEILIADKNFINKNLLLLKKIKLPSYTRFTKSDLFRQQFDNYIYIYIKN
jgi:hypothetical protein